MFEIFLWVMKTLFEISENSVFVVLLKNQGLLSSCTLCKRLKGSRRVIGESVGLLVWSRQVFKVNSKMMNGKIISIFFSNNRTYVVKFDIEMGVFEDEQFNEK